MSSTASVSTPPDDEPLITTGPAAALARVSPDTLIRAVRAGRLRAWRTPGGQYRFHRSDVLAALRPDTGDPR